MMNKKKITSVLLVAIIAIVLFIYKQQAFIFVQETLSSIRSLGYLGMLIYVLIYIVATVAFLPGSIITLAGGFIYGPWLGTGLVSFASVTGSFLAFLLSRSLFSTWIQEKAAKFPLWSKMDALLEKNGFKFTVLLRLSPLFPFNALNYLFGISRVKSKDYLLGSFLGMLPGTFLFVYMGSLLGSLSEVFAGNTPAQAGNYQKLFLGAGFLITIFIVVKITQMAKKVMKEELANES